MAKRRLEVVISGDASSLNRTFGAAQKAGGRFGKALGGVGKIAAGVLGGNLLTRGVDAITSGFGSMIEEAREAARIGRVTDAELKSTGATSWTSAGQIDALAEKTSQLIGVDDDLIQSHANLLLTFTNVRNEVGKGNDVFDRSVVLAQDMAEVMGTDAKASALQLGKALNDPIKGVTALGRAGVQFSKEQKEQIKTLVESGDLLGAQRIILDEVAKQFGGAAEAAADPAQKLQVTWDNLKERVGTAVLPILNQAATWLGKKLPIAFEAVTRAARPVVEWFRRNWPEIAMTAKAVFNDIRDVVRVVWPIVQQIIETAMQGIRSFMEEHWPAIRDVIVSAVELISAVIERFVAVATWLWEKFGNNILDFVERVWPNIQQVIGGVLDTITAIFRIFAAVFRGEWGKAWNGVKDLLSGVWQIIQGVVKGALEALRATVIVIMEGVWTAIRNVWDRIVDFFKGIPGRLASAGAGMFDFLKQAFRSAVNFIIDAWNGLEFKIPGFDPPGPGPKFGGFTLGVPDIPRLHSGGMFQAPNGAREGLALLESGERVLPRGRTGGDIYITVHAGMGTDGAQVGRQIRDALYALSRKEPLRLPA